MLSSTIATATRLLRPQVVRAALSTTAKSAKPKVYVVYYSLYGHVRALADQVMEGLKEGGADAKLFQVAETLTPEILKVVKAPPRDESVPTITAKDLEDADGILFGVPTRYGMMAGQMKAFLDSTGGQFAQGKLVGKTAGVFVSTNTQGGGQETTALTFVTQFAHHGMIFVPMGYTSPISNITSEMRGGSAYGAGTFAGGDGTRTPSQLEKDLAHHQGKLFAQTTAAFKAGRAVLAGSN